MFQKMLLRQALVVVLLASCLGCAGVNSRTEPRDDRQGSAGLSSPEIGSQAGPAINAEASGRSEVSRAVPQPVASDANAIFFQRGSSAVDEAGDEKLRQHASRLHEDAQLQVMLVGHTDDLGSRSYNLAVAEQRTTAVANRLREMGVRRSQIRRASSGYEQAARTCRGESCRSQMRRVDLIYPKPKSAVRSVGKPGK